MRSRPSTMSPSTYRRPLMKTIRCVGTSEKMSASSLSDRFVLEEIGGGTGVSGVLPTDGTWGDGTGRWGVGTGAGGGACGATAGAGGAAAAERATGDGLSARGTLLDGGSAIAARGSTTGRGASGVTD